MPSVMLLPPDTRPEAPRSMGSCTSITSVLGSHNAAPPFLEPHARRSARASATIRPGPGLAAAACVGFAPSEHGRI